MSKMPEPVPLTARLCVHIVEIIKNARVDRMRGNFVFESRAVE